MEKLFARCYTICEHKIRCCVCSVPWKKWVLHCFEEQAGSNCHLQYFTPHVCNCSDSIAKPFQAITIFTRPLSSSFKHLDHSTNCVFFLYFPRWKLFGNRNPLQNHFKLELPFSLAPPRSRFKLAHPVHLRGVLVFVFSVTAEMIYHPGSLQTCN